MKFDMFHVLGRLLRRCHSWLNQYQASILENECKHVGRNLSIAYPAQTHCLGNVSIGDNFHAGERLKLRTFSKWGGDVLNPNITIGNNVNIESDCHISAINSVIIEDGVLMASFVFISDHSHGALTPDELSLCPIARPLISKGAIRICRNAWLGEKVSVMPGVTIGESAIIGANSVVTHDIPPFSVACGAPAKVIRTIR